MIYFIITTITIFIIIQIITFIINNVKKNGEKISPKNNENDKKGVPEEQPRENPTNQPFEQPSIRNLENSNSEKDLSRFGLSDESQNLSSCSLNSRPMRVRRKPQRYSNEFVYY